MRFVITLPIRLLLLYFVSFHATGQKVYTPPGKETIKQKLAAIPDHPRLLLLAGGENKLKEQVIKDPVKRKVHEAILKESDAILTSQPVERIQIGRRLLDKSRECLRRVFLLSYAYRMTADSRYYERAEKELLAVSAFSDWNPSHFLDVAEMTMAVAIGYDWLYHHLSANSRSIIRTAIIEKGINPSLDSKNNNFLKVENNWNQVCNAGMTFGALAISEDEPELAANIITRAFETIPTSMRPYAPDGGYPEGYGYWEYGTSFNVLFIDAVEKALGTSFGLDQIDGFLKTAGFLQNMISPIGKVYNWGDSGLGAGLSAASFWFAGKNNDPSLIWVQKKISENLPAEIVRNRILPSMLIWSAELDLNKIKQPQSKIWVGQGDSPVALMRTDWNSPDAIYVGLKAGSANVNHAHMDVGSFIIDALGERWAMDFGMQNYHSLETKGVKLWGRAQNAQRWEIFRYNNRVHNTLTIDNELHKAKGYAKINSWSDKENFLAATTDLSDIFLPGKVRSSVRGIAIAEKKNVIVRDELTAEKDMVLRWTLLTPADATIISDNTIELKQNGKKVYLTFNADMPIKIKTWSTDPPQDYDAKNPGTQIVGFEANVAAGKTININAVFGLTPQANFPIPALNAWPVNHYSK
jgi:hypothetical protein